MQVRGLFHGWLIVGLGFVIMVVVFGSRFTLGLFLPGLTLELESSASDISFIFAFATLLSGFTQPMAGMLSDRFGPSLVITAGLVMMGVAFVGTGFAVSWWQVMILIGVLSGVAFSAVNLVILSALITRWFRRYRGRALGVMTAGSKIGTLVILPITGAIITAFGWRPAMILLGVSLLVMAPAVWRYMRSNPEEMGLYPDGDPAPDLRPASIDDSADAGQTAPADASRIDTRARALVRNPIFWLLTISLFGNGFMMNLVYVHMPSYIMLRGYSPLVATGVIATMGGIGIVGSIASGTMSDLIGNKLVLAVLYLARALATTMIIFDPSLWEIYLFAAIFGFLGYGAVALTASITSETFPPYAFGAVFGLMYVLHQVGGAVGTYIGGLSIDLTGSYQAAFAVSAAVCLVSTVAVILVPIPPRRARPKRV